MIRLLLPALLVLAIAPAPPCLGQTAPPPPGRDLAAACANCHATNGVSKSGIPSLAGRERSELVRLVQEFKSGRRPATVMHQIARGYSDEQIEAIAAYLSAQTR
ncbi:MAG TPA: c-type cytochrome [Burkholderiales bacterium]|nr:c-type cytochrome [Burkholderiales bacterium]